MCCFSGRVRHVARTRIYARADRGAERQSLAYAMSFSAADPVALILPIPVASAAEDAVRFVDLSGSPRFFDEINSAFPLPLMARSATLSADPQPQALVVHEVGHLEASFVPTADDFVRLDARFRLPRATIGALPEQHDYGFVVVKLGASATSTNVHPIAFHFPRRDRSRIFFPTVHVHDGAVHATARFDHELYVQGAAPDGWIASRRSLATHVDAPWARAFVDDAPGYKVKLYGERANRDTWV